MKGEDDGVHLFVVSYEDYVVGLPPSPAAIVEFKTPQKIMKLLDILDKVLWMPWIGKAVLSAVSKRCPRILFNFSADSIDPQAIRRGTQSKTRADHSV